MRNKEEEAIFNFYRRFVDYIREVDINMWQRARDYAFDYHDTKGVVLTKNEDTLE
jgi:hypothetical protein